jgi:hypothetical protein
MSKKLWIGFIAVFVAGFILDYIIHQVLLSGLYEETAHLWRPEEEMKMGLMIVTGIFFAFFFTLIFSKGYEGKGILEGIRYGFYVAMMVVLPMAYGTYSYMDIPYSLALQWFIYGTIELIILGIVLALVYGGKAAAPKAA